jgi:hypothetical protein
MQVYSNKKHIKDLPNKNLRFSFLTHAHQIPLKTCPKNLAFRSNLLPNEATTQTSLIISLPFEMARLAVN